MAANKAELYFHTNLCLHQIASPFLLKCYADTMNGGGFLEEGHEGRYT